MVNKQKVLWYMYDPDLTSQINLLWIYLIMIISTSNLIWHHNFCFVHYHNYLFTLILDINRETCIRDISIHFVLF